MDQGTSQNAAQIVGHHLGINISRPAYVAALLRVRDEGATVQIGPHTISRFYDARWGDQPGCRVIQIVPRFDALGAHDVTFSSRVGGFCFASVSVRRIAANMAREANPYGV